jgi:D-proline reductase (dithiol) PrdB
MPRLDSLPESFANLLRGIPGPTLGDTPWTPAAPASQLRIAIVTTAGLHRRGDRPFSLDSGDYRVLPSSARDELVMSHISPNVDRAGFAEDVNVVFPIDRLHELEASGEVGSVADLHYSFMGATNADLMRESAIDLATHLHADGVTGVLLVPV